MKILALIRAWRETLTGPDKSWVLFENGICVILMAPATALLKEWGPVHVGSPTATTALETHRPGNSAGKPMDVQSHSACPADTGNAMNTDNRPFLQQVRHLMPDTP
ncbi:MAG: hypothetical protein LBL59_10605 [Xanthomonadaceae bacterium]|jgi:hypothetical protein|nr:hypothetical protein [Xanthomonadaceae bacterium]